MNFPSVGRVKPVVPRTKSVSVSAELHSHCFHFPHEASRSLLLRIFIHRLFHSLQSSILPSLNEVKTGTHPLLYLHKQTSPQITPTGWVWRCHFVSEPTVGMRRGTFPTTLPPPPSPSGRPPPPAYMKEAKVREDRLERCSGLPADAVTVEFSKWPQLSVFIPAPQFLSRQTYGLRVRLCFSKSFFIWRYIG